MNRTERVIEIDNVSFSYGEGTVLEKVNLTVNSGDFLAIVGPNGGGKTTLVKLILGLLKPVEGRIRVFGAETAAALDRIAYVPQDTEFNRSFPITVREVVAMGKKASSKKFSFRRTAGREQVEFWLSRLGLTDLSLNRLAALSNGQRKRVFIARALCAEPSLLIMDEPLASVDVESQELFFNILQEWRKRSTMIMVTHDTGVVARYVTSVVCVNRELVQHDSLRLDNETFERVYGRHLQVMTHGPVHVLHKKESESG